MVVCKFFLQGTCKFGNSCKFEHQLNTGNYGANSSILVQNSATKQPTVIDASTLIKSVVNDMTTAEKGGQWLLSSYAPFKEKPAFPGFEDHSMEEIRYLFYEAAKTQTLEQFKQNLQMMLQQAIMRIKSLQVPSPDVVNILKQIYDTHPSASKPPTNASPFGTNASSIFGGGQPQQSSSFQGGQPQNSIFGSAPPNQYLLPQSGFVQNSVFGGNNSQQNPIFGGSNQNSVFGASQQTGGSIFGNNVAPTPGGSLFSGNSGGNSIFGGNTQSVFSQSSFKPVPTTQQPNLFQNSGGVFSQQSSGQNFPVGAPPQPSNIFGSLPPVTTQASTVFNQPAAVPQVNPQSVQNKPAFQHTQSIFGNLGLQNSGTSLFGNVTAEKPNEEFYSKLEELTEEEIKWFESDDLDICKIPEKPPTYEMCFKT